MGMRQQYSTLVGREVLEGGDGKGGAGVGLTGSGRGVEGDEELLGIGRCMMGRGSMIVVGRVVRVSRSRLKKVRMRVVM